MDPVKVEDFVNEMLTLANMTHDCMVVAAHELYYQMVEGGLIESVRPDEVSNFMALLACNVLNECTAQISGQALSLIQAQEILKNPPGDTTETQD